MLKNEELFFGVYRAWYAMLSTSRGDEYRQEKVGGYVKGKCFV